MNIYISKVLLDGIKKTEREYMVKTFFGLKKRVTSIAGSYRRTEHLKN
jgi:hypothetical protein